MNAPRLSFLQPLAAGLLLLLSGHSAESILGSKHDLSAGGPGPIKAVAESEVCLFCHTPHRAIGQTPLWNHALSSATYTPYNSPTLQATVGQPNGASKLCLSCHDGTVALGMVRSRVRPIAMQRAVTTMPAGRANLGTDLSDDHPVSFRYDAALAAADGQLRDPSTLVAKVRLDHNGQLQCTSCHEAHNNEFGKFLVQDNTRSALCVNCHELRWWVGSAHRNSPKTWNGVGLDPWPHTSLATVAANGCENCHAPHAAGTRAQLLNFPNEEQNCYSCHSGTVATKHLAADFNKISVHPITLSSGLHQPDEDIVNPTSRHVECADCHNPHAAQASPAARPHASGALEGVAGVTSSGALVASVTQEYELCFRCHADSLARGPAVVTRQFPETNTRREFSPTARSSHPVVAAGKNPNVPSLLAPWTTSSLIYCTDCHNSDQGPNTGGVGPNGPHGSNYPPLLERNLVWVDYQTEHSGQYALCYKCHDRDTLLYGNGGAYGNVAKLHAKHVVEEKTACTTCHDPHGVPGETHLLNFNTTYVSPENGRIEFVDQGTFRGTCTLRCHEHSHVREPYDE